MGPDQAHYINWTAAEELMDMVEEEEGAGGEADGVTVNSLFVGEGSH